jgi:subtilisin family serine protease
MKTKKLNPIFLIFCLAFFGLILFVPNKASLQVTRPEPPPPADLGAIAVEKDILNPKIEYVLGKLYNIYLMQGADAAREFAAMRGIDLDGNQVRVVAEAVYANRTQNLFPEAAALKAHIQAIGGKVEATADNLVQSMVPISSVEPLSQYPLVGYLRLPFKPVAMEVTSEGVNSTGANLWQSLSPYRNTAGANVCVLDLGFSGYTSLLGNELPSSVKTQSFRSDGSLTASQVHGTACAEIIHDMAPNAALTLVNFSTDVEHRNAVNWITNQTPKIDVISYSVGWYNVSDGKGTGSICADVDTAANKGIVWVGAAGNDALDHFEGTFNDPDNDKWYNFPDGSEIEAFYVPALYLVAAFLNWDDWGTWNGTSYSGSGNDYDLYLYYKSTTSNTWYLADDSIDLQNGTQKPRESIGYWYSTLSRWWGVGIYKWSGPRACKMELFTMGNSGAINNNVPAGSLLVPADSANAVTVGAVDWSDDSREPYHTYSSQGPTHDGRTKPDFSAPSRVSCSSTTYGNLGFSGTSSATPHVAGAIALLKEKTPYNLEQIYQVLEGRVKDLGPAGKDSIYGAGSLKLKKN